MNNFSVIINSLPWGWREGSAVKSTGCPYRGPEFNSQHPHGGSQPYTVESDALLHHKGIYADRALMYTKNK